MITQTLTLEDGDVGVISHLLQREWRFCANRAAGYAEGSLAHKRATEAAERNLARLQRFHAACDIYRCSLPRDWREQVEATGTFTHGTVGEDT